MTLKGAMMFKRLFIALSALVLSGALVFALGTAPSSSGGGAKSSNASVSSAPSTATQFYAAGYSASQAGRYDEAMADFKSAISLKADYAEAYNMLGFCLRKTGNTKEAFANYEKALSLKPNFPEAREYYGESFLQVDDLKNALRQYVLLQKAGKPQAKELLESIATYLDAHPGA
jgi:Flp pilus assembly protein TadD